jgi:hypothetical protein
VALDLQLRERGLVTLSELRRRFSGDYARILRRGKISNETQYYLVMGILNDNAFGISTQERDILSRLANGFEQHATESFARGRKP